MFRGSGPVHGHVTGRTKLAAAKHLGDALEALTGSGFIDLGPMRDWNKGAIDAGPVRFLAGHDVGGDMADVIAAAKESVVIESPYFIPPRFFRRLLLKKLAEGSHRRGDNSVRSTDGLLPQGLPEIPRRSGARRHRLSRVQGPGVPARVWAIRLLLPILEHQL